MMLRKKMRAPWLFGFSLLATIFLASSHAENVASPAETKIEGPPGTSIVVRMQGPYDAAVALQIVCYFKHTADSDQRLTGAPVELDKRLGGVIASLRARGDYSGEALETILLECPAGTIAAKQLLLVGLGDESTLSLDRLEQVGRVALREASRLGATQVAFAPLIKDAGNNSLEAGAVETAIVRGMLTAYDTDRRLQAEKFRRPYQLETWIVEAGPKYYDETIVGVKKAIAQSAELVASKSNAAYSQIPK